MTVSRASASPAPVSEKMRRKVDAAVRQFGYLPNRIAGSLSSKRSNVVGLIVPSIRNSLYATMIQAISDVLRANGLHLMIANSGHRLARRGGARLRLARPTRLRPRAAQHQRTASGCASSSANTDVPVVETGNLPVAPLDMAVSYSNFEAARAMTTHLGRLGYRRIGFVTLPLCRQRPLAGAPPRLFRGAEGAWFFGGCGSRSGSGRRLQRRRRFAGRLVQAYPDIDAGFFAGDVLAVGALFECQRRGWAVPGRIAIASFDDLDLLRHAVPTVTTLRIPRQDIGRRSAELLVNRLHGAPPEKVRIDVGFEIVQRESS